MQKILIDVALVEQVLRVVEYAAHDVLTGRNAAQDLREALAQPRADYVALLPGWKIVPLKVTEAMHQAAVRAIVKCSGNDDFPPSVYGAMLEAAPKMGVTDPETGAENLEAEAPDVPEVELSSEDSRSDDTEKQSTPLWKMVPIDPTPKMSAAGFSVNEGEHDPAGVYRAMLEAAPKPPSTSNDRELLGQAFQALSNMADMAVRSALDTTKPNSVTEEESQPVGVAGTMPGANGFTMACFSASEVPVGTKLYVCQPSSAVEQKREESETGYALVGEVDDWEDAIFSRYVEDLPSGTQLYAILPKEE